MVSQQIRGKQHDQFVNEVRVDDIVHGDPTEKSVEGLQTSPNERLLSLMQILQYQLTQLKNSRKIRVHLFLEFLDLHLRHLILGVIEYFLTEHFEDIEVVLADVHIFGG